MLIETLKVFLPIVLAVAAGSQNDKAVKQLPNFKKNTSGPIGILTTMTGAPVEYKEATSSLNTNLFSNQYLIESLTQSVRERIPERVVHAPGAGAFGNFEVTHDISHICKAKLFSSIGKKTPVAVRFSITGPRIGTDDRLRQSSRGMAVRFYTEEGNFDLPCLNTPIFTFKDPLLFPSLSHILKPNPATNLPDVNMLWDFLTLHPESIYQTIYLLSDYGFPHSYRHMPAYPIHTHQVYNAAGETFFVRWYFFPDAGIKAFNSSEAVGNDAYYFARDLYNTIANGEYPKWQLKVQILCEKDVKEADIDVFDVTNTLPYDKYPLHSVGVVTLNRNPVNFYAEMEQMAVCSGNVVPGVTGGLDTLFDARRFTYREAHTHRLGSNVNRIPVNCPIQGQVLFTYNRDGVPPVSMNGKDGPNYIPNSFNGPVPCHDKNRPPPKKILEKEPNNFKQAGDFYSKELSKQEQRSLVDNIVNSICPCENIIKNRLLHWLKVINSDLGNRVEKGLAANCTNQR